MARRRSQRRYRDPARRLGWPPPDWADLHPDLLSCILHRLDQAELLTGGVAGVCRSWRRAARKEPELWRRIDLSGGQWYVPPCRPKVSISAMVRAALRFAAGQCEAFLSECVDDELLLIIAKQAPLLKSLHLITGFFSNEGLGKAINMLPLLEELEISLRADRYTPKVVELVAVSCPLLKHFRLVTPTRYLQNDTALDASMVARMHKLRSLHLVGLNLDNKGLTTILDNCHDLEYLNMRLCSHIAMDYSLRVKLARINMDNREYLSDNNWYEYLYDHSYYNHPYDCACRHCSRSNLYYDDGYPYYDDGYPYYDGGYRYYDYGYRYYDDDLYDTYYYCNGGDDDVDDADLEEHEKILDIKSMRRYLRW
ncbi:unnamed protein product [Alopecurus aequalis]